MTMRFFVICSDLTVNIKAKLVTDNHICGQFYRNKQCNFYWLVFIFCHIFTGVLDVQFWLSNIYETLSNFSSQKVVSPRNALCLAECTSLPSVSLFVAKSVNCLFSCCLYRRPCGSKTAWLICFVLSLYISRGRVQTACPSWLTALCLFFWS